MNKLLKDLKRICNENLLTEKILIMSSYSDGQQLKETATRAGFPFFNLRVETLLGLAMDKYSINLYQERKQVIEPSISMIYIAEILNELKDNNDLEYFTNIQINPGFANAVYKTILDLRMAGFNSLNIDDSSFVNLKKAIDLKKVLGKYENMLNNNNFLDEAELYLSVVKDCKSDDDNAIYIVPSNIRLTSVESKFLNFLTKDTVHSIGIKNIPNLDMPSSYYIKRKSSEASLLTERNPFEFMYNINNLPSNLENLDIHFVRAYGTSNEVKEVIRDIKEKKIKFDNTLILYTVQEPYVQFFYQNSQKLNLPITYGDGIDIRNSNPSKLYFGLLELIQSDFNVLKLTSMFTSGIISLSENSPSSVKISKLLKESKVGWGKKRYKESILRTIQSYEKKLVDEDNEDQRTYLENKINDLICLNNILIELLEDMPIAKIDEKVEVSKLAEHIFKVVENFSRIRNEIDAEAREKILNELSVIINYSKEQVDMNNAINLLIDLIKELRVGASNPKPGYIHLASYKKGIWACRDKMYIIGLDSTKFPGKSSENPVLLDVERESLGNGILLNRNIVKENQYEMARLLNENNSSLYLSYCSFDTLENKSQSPCSVLLQVYRLYMKDGKKDYEDLLKYLTEIAGYIPRSKDHILDENEWWLQNKVSGTQDAQGLFAKIYTNLSLGIEASKKRCSNEFNEYHGKIKFESNLNEGGKNKNLIFSSSRLELLASCPYKYFLKYILNIRVPEEIEYNRMQWLDALQRGTLLHSIFEIFHNRLKNINENEKPSINKHESIIYNIAENELIKYRMEFPPPNNIVYEIERKEILDSCRVFLACEEEFIDSTPVYFELPFGINGETHDELGEIKSVKLMLPSGTIYINGKIDRVNQVDKEKYMIIDYKTGSTYGYNDKEYFKKGKHLQHAIYGIALETILKEKGICESPKVAMALYTFPTVKGEGHIVVRHSDKRDQVLEILDKLLRVCTNGSFISTEDESQCKYCEYILVCKDIKDSKVIEKIKMNSKDLGIECLRGLGIYE